MADLVSQSAQAIADALAPSPQAPSARWRWGTVVSVSNTGTMNVAIGGATVPGIRCAQHVMGAQVGDRVRVLYCGTEAMVDAVRASSKLMSLPRITVKGAYADLQSTNITDGTAVSSTTTGNARVRFTDSSGSQIGAIFPRYFASGLQGMRLIAARDVSGTTMYNELMLALDASGNCNVTFAGTGVRGAWLSALDLLTQDVAFTANTANWTASTSNVKRSGKVVSITLTGQAKAGVGTWQNETYTIGTLAVGAAAWTEVVAIAQISSNFAPILCAVHDDGKIYLRTAATAIPANTWMWISGTYITS